ncbi:WD40-repeat-containing domain protein [Paraphysoderma sedebokerense]|nr:WD40-repeat-containing domain protein [Paraphysoderma sedebokerense]
MATTIAELTGHTDRVWQLSWHPNGSLLASSSSDKSIRLWHPTKPIRTIDNSEPSTPLSQVPWQCASTLTDGHKRTVRSISFSPDGNLIASAGFDATIGIWEKVMGKGGWDYEYIATLEGHENEAKCVSWNADGTLLATCSRDKSVWIWEVEKDNDFECLSVLQEHTQDVKLVAWHPNEEILASASYDDTIRIWRDDDDDWYCADVLEGHDSTVWSLDFDKNGNNIVSVSDDRTIKFWHRTTPSGSMSVKYQCYHTIPDAHERTIYSVSWNKWNGLILTCGGDNRIKIWEMVTYLLRSILPSNFN